MAGMTYAEAIESQVTYWLVKSEIEKHGEKMHKFTDEFGIHEAYNASDVLGWLGY